MRKTKLVMMLAAITLVVGCFSGCKGPEGPAGVQGTKGDTGAKGDPGTANVIYSPWRAAGTWTKGVFNGVEKSYVDIAAPAVSTDILNQGVVMVYVRLQTDIQNIYPLPYLVKAFFTEEQLDFSLRPGVIRIWSTSSVPPTSTNEFRYVIIPGGQAGRFSGETLSYEQVKEWYNLPD